MLKTHGYAEPLRPDVDLDALDRLLDSGGDPGEEAARVVLANDFLGPSRFGRMFQDAEKFRPPDSALVNLGRAMTELAPRDPAFDNSAIPAGFTYLGQFIDHDVTFDQTEDFPQIDNPNQLRQGRTPTLDLDSLYGRGPKSQPELYDETTPPGRARFKIGITSAPSPGGLGRPPITDRLPNDLPRRPDKRAIIGDPRNDENLLVAQTHLAFLKFHNKVLDTLPPSRRAEDEDAAFTQDEEDTKKTSFHRARRLVRWHYQWIVLNDFVARIVDPTILDDVRTNGRRFYDFDQAPFNGTPFMPLEFSAGAYRLGHSMIREVYNYNRVFAFPSASSTALTPASLRLLFQFTGGGGFIGDHITLPTNWVIDWRRFIDVGDPDHLNFTRRLDTKVAPQLHRMPFFPPGDLQSLAVRNLIRGSRVGLPTGQDVAEIVGASALNPNEIASGDEADVVTEHGFHERTPLWFYVLKEAEVQGEGKRMGEVGSRIVAEVFVGLLEGDPHSFLSKQPRWKPTLPSASPGSFTTADLLRIVGEINPLGD